MSVIRFENVSKRFVLNKRSRSFQEILLNLSRKSSAVPPRAREFWALREVSFEIAASETVGFVGPNGVGKSTVLKLVANIIEPTSGRISVRGRIGALLELGAGFHPDLSGRENIYVNASIMGLSRRDVDRRLDAIISFAEMEPFIDVPVKHYSSGMYVRLGFSVAVHTEPEILLVDEVLAVGDAAFQRKCLERIDRLRADGVTLLFVSHSAEMVRSICSRAIWLDSGLLVADGAAESVMQQYTMHSWAAEEGRLQATSDVRWGTGRVQITRVQLLDKDGHETQLFTTGEPMMIALHYQAAERVPQPVFGLAIHRRDGVHVTGPNTQLAGIDISMVEGEGTVLYELKSLPLLAGVYAISVAVCDSAPDAEMYDYHDQLYPFRVHSEPGGEQYGLLKLGGQWVCKGPLGM